MPCSQPAVITDVLASAGLVGRTKIPRSAAAVIVCDFHPTDSGLVVIVSLNSTGTSVAFVSC